LISMIVAHLDLDAFFAAVAKFCAALVRSVVQSATSLHTAHPEAP